MTNRNSFAALDDVIGEVALEVDGVRVASKMMSEWYYRRNGQPKELSIEMPSLRTSHQRAVTIPSFRSMPLSLSPSNARSRPIGCPSYAASLRRMIGSQEQFPVPPPPITTALPKQLPKSAPTTPSVMRCLEHSDRFVISGNRLGAPGGEFELTVQKSDGSIGPYIAGGKTLLASGGSGLTLYRPPTENDNGKTISTICQPHEDAMRVMSLYVRFVTAAQFYLPYWILDVATSHNDLWQSDGLDSLVRTVVSVKVTHPTLPPPEPSKKKKGGEKKGRGASKGGNNGANAAPPSPAAVEQRTHILTSTERIELALIIALTSPIDGSLRATHTMRLNVLPTGVVLIENDATIIMASSNSLPRIGLHFKLPAGGGGGGGAAKWFGRGPHENYSDRKVSAHVGVHSLSYSELGAELTDGYVYPQTCGERCDVRWLDLASSEGDPSLSVCGGAPFGFSLLPSDDAAIAKAAHPHELEEEGEEDDGGLHLTINHKMMGVGGDTGWFQSVRPPFLIPDGTHKWALLLAPGGEKAGLPAMLAERVRSLQQDAYAPLTFAARHLPNAGAWLALLRTMIVMMVRLALLAGLVAIRMYVL